VLTVGTLFVLRATIGKKNHEDYKAWLATTKKEA
jgi:hypothetical protein